METLPIIAYPSSLVSIELLGDRGLRVVLEERSGLGLTVNDPILGAGRDTICGTGDAVFEVTWPVVVCSAVRGDPFPKGTPAHSTLQEKTDTAFLRWVEAESHAGADYVAAMAGEEQAGRELRHWVINSHEAHIDVAAIAPPTVKRLGGASI